MKPEADPFVDLSDVESKELSWLWKPYILRSMLNILEGDPDLGKSLLAMHIGAQVTTGGSLLGSGLDRPRRVIYLSAEDDNAYTIRPRMEAMGADLDRVAVLVDYLAMDQNGISALAQEAGAGDVGLIVVDPIMGFMSADGDPYRPTVIRAFLKELTKIAEDAEAALLVVRHLAKAKHDKAIYKGAGSIDQIGVARSALRVAAHPDDPSLRILAHLKHNLSAPGPNLLFEVTASPQPSVPMIVWHGETSLGLNDIDGALDDDERSEVEHAKTFLAERLVGQRVRASAIYKAAAAASISERTLQRAKEALRVRSDRKGGTVWFWSLPDASNIAKRAKNAS